MGGAGASALAASAFELAWARAGVAAASFAAAEFSVATGVVLGDDTTARTRSCPFTGGVAPPAGEAGAGGGGIDGLKEAGVAVDFFAADGLRAADVAAVAEVAELDTSAASLPMTICATCSLRISA